MTIAPVPDFIFRAPWAVDRAPGETELRGAPGLGPEVRASGPAAACT